MSHVYELATALHNGAGNFFQNRFSYQLSEAGAFTPYEYADHLIDSWLTNIETPYLQLMGSDVILDFVTAKRVQSPGGPSSTRIVGDGGTGTGACKSAGLCADLAWQTAGSSNRPGHTYIGAIPSGAIVNDVFQAGFQADALAFINAITTSLALAGGAGNADFGVYSRKLNQFNSATVGLLKPKPTLLNKRTVPLV